MTLKGYEGNLKNNSLHKFENPDYIVQFVKKHTLPKFNHDDNLYSLINHLIH